MSTSWIRPTTRPVEIDQLVDGVDRYNPANVSYLEDYLYQQTRQQEYDCLANLAILKLYQFNPDLYNSDVVVNILIKALTAAPLPDFNLCLAILGERQLSSSNMTDAEPDPLVTLLPELENLSQLLFTCRFPAFWSTFHSDDLAPLRDNYTIECVGFEDAVREVVVRAVKATFSKIGSQRLGSYLDLAGLGFERYVASQGWSLDATKGVVTIPPNADNVVRATVQAEDIKLQQLTKVIHHAHLP